jgi:hypothetical protein
VVVGSKLYEITAIDASEAGSEAGELDWVIAI